MRIRSEHEDAEQARKLLDSAVAEVESRLGSIVFGRDEATIAMTLIDELRGAGRMIATAESCTGGLIGKMLTDVAGSSDVYTGGWVTYTNQMKQQQLGVSHAVLSAHGAVSGQTVCEMASGALQRSGADIAISVSGIAGPGGGTADKPVGTVWIGVAEKATGADVRASAVCVRLPGGREQVRSRAAMCALQLARFTLLGIPVKGLSWITQTHPETTDILDTATKQ